MMIATTGRLVWKQWIRSTAEKGILDGGGALLQHLRRTLSIVAKRSAHSNPHSSQLAVEKLVLYEDNKLIVLNKPSGYIVQGAQPDNPSHQSTNFLELVKQYIQQKYNKKGDVFLGVVHRIDRVTSGIVVFARNTKASRRLTESFANRNQVQKVYVCLVHGDVPVERQTVISYMEYDDGFAKVFDADTVTASKDGESTERKQAILSFEKLYTFQGPKQAPTVNMRGSPTNTTMSLLRVLLQTGRKHQIRAQVAHLGHPIVADTAYGGSDVGNVFGKNAIALHALELGIKYPGDLEVAGVKRSRIKCCVPPPMSWIRLMGQEVFDRIFADYAARVDLLTDDVSVR
jgi:23S rRNA pseudouridine1911/1915/1917 synthase